MRSACALKAPLLLSVLYIGEKTTCQPRLGAVLTQTYNTPISLFAFRLSTTAQNVFFSLSLYV